MPYYSVRITGGENCRIAGLEAREMLRGRSPDYTPDTNFFYVERAYSAAKLKLNLSSFEYDGYEVLVEEITQAEFESSLLT